MVAAQIPLPNSVIGPPRRHIEAAAAVFKLVLQVALARRVAHNHVDLSNLIPGHNWNESEFHS